MTRTLCVNGVQVAVEAGDMRSLLAVLREDVGLLGAKLGCGEGRCGACTVLVDGLPVVSCLLPSILAEGRQIKTVEGLAGSDGALNELQERLLEYGGVQCGACIPGVLMSLTALLDNRAHPSEHEARLALAGNVCRCTGYSQMVTAVRSLATTEGATE